MFRVVQGDRKVDRVALVVLVLAHNEQDKEGSTATIPTHAKSYGYRIATNLSTQKLYRVHVMDLSYALYALVLSVFLPF
jgi:hypothetical protein